MRRKWNNKVLCHLAVVILIALNLGRLAYGQRPDILSLEKCYSLAIEFSTLSKQNLLNQNIAEANRQTVNSGYLPQAEINGQATYQNDVIPVESFGYQALSKDQYKATLDLKQVIYDGGYISHQKQLFKTGLKIEQVKLDISKQQLKERINNFYLSILLINENISLVELLRKDIRASIVNLSALLINGITLKSNVDILEAELLKADQKLIELEVNKKSTIEMLSIILGKEIPDNMVFTIPEVEKVKNDMDSNRAEYKLFEIQKTNLQNQYGLNDSKNMPKLYLFANGGYGRPGYNMLSNDFTWLYITGVQLSIPLTHWITTHRENKVITYQQSLIDIQKEDFSRNNQMQMKQQLNEIEMYRLLIEKDKSIITKRIEIKETVAAKLSNGISTSNDFLTELNAENQSMLNLKLHEIQLLQATLAYKSLIGNN